MFRRYKEIWYGLLFGLGAIGIDLLMHSSREDRSVTEELSAGNAATIVYRLLFLAFGAALGWLMWRNAKHEREFRRMEEDLARFRGQLTPLVTVSYSKLQFMLTRPEAESLPLPVRDTLVTMQSDLNRLKSGLESLSQHQE